MTKINQDDQTSKFEDKTNSHFKMTNVFKSQDDKNNFKWMSLLKGSNFARS